MKTVIVFEYVKRPGEKYLEKVEKCKAFFHQFGVNFEEFENGAGNFSTAIVEYADGTVDNVQVELIKFTPNVTESEVRNG